MDALQPVVPSLATMVRPQSTSRNYFQVISTSLELGGFIVLDYFHRAKEVQDILKKAITDDHLELSDGSETVVQIKSEDILKTWLKLFGGGNNGKLITSL